MKVSRSQAVTAAAAVVATLGAVALAAGLIATFGRCHAAHVLSQQITKHLGDKGQMGLMISGGSAFAVAMTVLGVNRYLSQKAESSKTGQDRAAAGREASEGLAQRLVLRTASQVGAPVSVEPTIEEFTFGWGTQWFRPVASDSGKGSDVDQFLDESFDNFVRNDA